MVRFFLLFLTIQAVLFGVEMLQVVQDAVVLPWTALVAKMSAVVAKFFDPTTIASGKVLHSPGTGFGVSIEPGCNGVEATIVLIAAMLAFPSSWKMKFWGLGLGFLAVQFVNLLRVVSLFFIGQWNFKVFEFAHLYMWQALIMLDVLIVWLLWMRYVAKYDPKPPAATPSAAA
ncbi:MAG: exosortase H [Burkholderiaceae bacterium]|jgi:exosortase H (IPTLxxWG-CTERM-specific)|nr:exosortase H [Burkholderiaceae bacterium]